MDLRMKDATYLSRYELGPFVSGFDFRELTVLANGSSE